MRKRMFALSTLSASIAVVLHAAPAALAQSTQSLGSVQATASTTTTKSAPAAASSKVYTRRRLLRSTQTVKTVTRREIDLLGPAAGGMQALGLLPNVKISSYSPLSVSSRSTLSMRGVKVGNNSIPGDLATNAITAELDGVPLNSLIQGTGWHSPEVPIGALLQGINVVQGPGDARDRWYDSLGGTVDFVPMQPRRHALTRLGLSLGSHSTAVLSVLHATGEHDGWSTVFGAAGAHSHSYRSGPTLQSSTLQGYFKTRKSLEGGSLSFGAYALNNSEHRPNMIPVSAADAAANGIHLDGTGGSGPLYSQQSSGFYSTLPASLWQKHIYIKDDMGWTRLRLAISSGLRMSNLLWVRNGNVEHYRQNYFINGGATSSNAGEYYVEHSLTYGDRLVFDQRIDRHNTLSYGGYILSSRSTNDYIGYTPNPGIGLDGSGITTADINTIGANTTTNLYWAAFLQDRIRPVRSLSVVPGIRFVSFETNFSNTTQAQAAGLGLSPGFATSTSTGDPTPDSSTSFHKAEPSLSLNWRIGQGLHAFGSYAIAYHNPRVGNYDPVTLLAPNLALLQLVKAKTFDAGLRYDARHLGALREVYASVDYFNTKLSNQTVRYSNPVNNQKMFATGAASLQGIDLQLRGDVGQHWLGFANLGWLDSNWDSYYSFSSQQSFDGMPVSNSPRITANLGLTYRYFSRSGVVDTTLWDQYTGAQYLFDNQIVGPTSQTNPSFNLVNLSIKDRMPHLIPDAKLTTLSLSVLNLFDKQYNSTAYISSGGYFNTSGGGYVIANPGAPRSIYLTLSAAF